MEDEELRSLKRTIFKGALEAIKVEHEREKEFIQTTIFTHQSIIQHLERSNAKLLHVRDEVAVWKSKGNYSAQELALEEQHCLWIETPMLEKVLTKRRWNKVEGTENLINLVCSSSFFIYSSKDRLRTR